MHELVLIAQSLTNTSQITAQVAYNCDKWQ